MIKKQQLISIRIKFFSLLYSFLFISGCASNSIVTRQSYSSKLESVGLICISEEEAFIPRSEKGLYLPCRVIPNFPSPPLEPCEEGYLIVGVNHNRSSPKKNITKAVSEWEPGETLYLTIRRNPHLQAEPVWYQFEIPLLLNAVPK